MRTEEQYQETPFEEGFRKGLFTHRTLWIMESSPVVQLQHLERVYVENMERTNLPNISPAYAEKQREYLRGYIVAARASLGAMIENDNS